MNFCYEIDWEGRLSRLFDLSYVKYYVKEHKIETKRREESIQKSDHSALCFESTRPQHEQNFNSVCRHPETARLSRSIQRSIELASLGRNLSQKSAFQNELQP